MSLEKPIIKAKAAAEQTYDYKPREFAGGSMVIARSFVDEDAFKSSDFKISELVAQQAGILQLESEAHQDQINTQVLARLSEVQERAYAEGYDLGLIEGTEKAFQEAKASLLDKMRDLENMLKVVEDLKSRRMIDNEAELIRLVFLTARKMALRDLEGNEDVVKDLIVSVIGESEADERVVVKLSAEDLYFIESLQEKTGQKIASLKRVHFVMDDKITPGGCLIETEFGTVDATLEERVARTWGTLQSRLPQRPPTPKRDPATGDKS